MITGLKINEAKKREYYEKGYWTSDTINDAWNQQVEKYPNNEYVSDNLGVRLTYSEIDDKASRLASWLVEQGVENGDVVTFQIPPWAEFCIIYVACVKVGAVCHPIAIVFNGEDLVYNLNLVETKVFICPTFHHKTNFEEQYLAVSERIPSVQGFAVLDKTLPSKGTITLDEIYASHEPLTTKPESKADDVALILTTSGTTGRPKAVLNTHNTLLSAERTFNKGMKLGHDDVMFMPAPLSHATGFNHGLLAPMIQGARVVLQQEFKPEEAVDIINREGVTWSMGATPFIYDLLNTLEEKNLEFTSLRMYICGGAPVPSAMIAQAYEHQVLLCECYGATESSPHIAVRPDDCVVWNGAWSGVAFEGIETMVVDANYKEVPRGVQGEEASRGPNVFVGYLNNRAATDEALTDEGWFLSGDLCYMDEEGRIRINGRKKEIIIRGGENVSANEVDENINGCPGVGAHATVGIPDDRLGERICTFVVPKGDITPTVESISEYLNSKGIAKRLRPEYVEYIDEIPMTPTGKIKRNMLSDELKNRLAQRAAAN